jgi:hypothetical protein
MKRKNITVTIEGTTPLLMNRFHEEAQQKVEGGTALAVNGDRGTPREQADPKVYRDSRGAIVLPGPNFFSCLIEAGKYHKVGKKQVTTGRSLAGSGRHLGRRDREPGDGDWRRAG